MDKVARAIRDKYNIHYTSALQLKQRITNAPVFAEQLKAAKERGVKYNDLVVDLAGHIIEEEFEDAQ